MEKIEFVAKKKAMREEIKNLKQMRVEIWQKLEPMIAEYKRLSAEYKTQFPKFKKTIKVEKNNVFEQKPASEIGSKIVN